MAGEAASTAPRIAFVDLARQQERLGRRLTDRMDAVLAHGAYIMGPEVAELEAELARFSGATHVISCSSGTDALLLLLMAWGIGPGDAVFVPTYTFSATAEVVALTGATPIFCDVDAATFNLDVATFEAAVDRVVAAGRLRPAAVIPVDLFGQPADHAAILPLAKRHGLRILSDAAQSFGATRDGHAVGTMGDATATSFFPAKPLGCYGDGGAVLTDDEELADIVRSLRVHGKGAHKYDAVRVGLTARLDTLQAAVLLAKLEVFPDELRARDAVASRYTELLGEYVVTPTLAEGVRSSWAQYTIRTGQRDALAAGLSQRGIPTAIYYPTPVDRQPAYQAVAAEHSGPCPVARDLAGSVLSLPMHPYLTADEQQRIADAVLAIL
jgi:dTDP-4-amino-4,6-dideoxygalactose transaminase